MLLFLLGKYLDVDWLGPVVQSCLWANPEQLDTVAEKPDACEPPHRVVGSLQVFIMDEKNVSFLLSSLSFCISALLVSSLQNSVWRRNPNFLHGL